MANEVIAVQVICDTEDEQKSAASSMAVLTKAARDNTLVAVGCRRKDNGDPALILCVMTEVIGMHAAYTPIGTIFNDPEFAFDSYLPPLKTMSPEDVENVSKH